jgi:hypothetical protein
MIANERYCQPEKNLTLKSIELGDRRINAEAQHIVQLAEQLGRVLSLDPAVRDAVIQKALLTMKTTTDLLTLIGSANPATNSDTKS